MTTLPTQDTDRDLVLTRVLNAPRDKVYRCWIEPELMKQWFAPKPWSTPKVELDLRVGGANVVTMADPEGNEFPNPGQYLEIVPNERLVFTDAYVGDWAPSEKPFFTAILTFEDAGEGKTKYTAVARHWTREDAEGHKKMGFHEGWGLCAAQLEELAARL
ncbi:MAG: SRPBCC family protein [Candidatus Devosia phytovorans]|uniref:SRPBCC family protein n=1 Tax=Candidatus Devosia phytovorans TaxID=3121372 RepID=A0AAJ5VYU6_9HYPH|nr:SRPBCC family protein [Devosia sp.]WEK06526.1 MAG: SRPBCC family protein [Devosia sp.]